MNTTGRIDQAASRSFQTQLIKRIQQSQLPSEDRPPKAQLVQVADFLQSAAGTRQPATALVKLESQSQGRRVTRIAIVNDDMPFLVDSIASTIAAQGLVVDFLVHPVVPVRRDAAGKLKGLRQEPGDGAIAESMIYIETGRVDAQQRRDLKHALELTLHDVRAAVTDWQAMAEAMAQDAEYVADEEGKALLSWLKDGMLTQLGHVTRRRNGRNTKALGVCRASTKAVLADATYDRAFEWFDARGKDAAKHAPLIIKANQISNVHRRVPMDLFIVPRMKDGKATALSINAGIWTSAALNTSSDSVPVMRRQFAALTERLGFDPAGHTGKAVLHALTTLPHDLMISFDDEDVCRIATRMSGLADRPRPGLALVEAPLARHLVAFVWLPRDMISTQTRLQIQGLLEEEAAATTLDWSLQVEEGALALLRFVLDIRESQSVPDEAALDARLQLMLRGWSEAVENALAEQEGPLRAAVLAQRYAGAFSQAYHISYGAAEAAIDIERIGRLASAEAGPEHLLRDARLYAKPGDEPGELRLKVYQLGGQLPLSDAVPALENFGFRVLAEVPSALDEGRIGTIHDFRLSLESGGEDTAIRARAREIEGAIAAVLNNRSEDDLFNRLVTIVGLEVAEVNWLRAMFRYLRQTGLAFTVQTVVGALAGAAGVTRGLIDLFHARLDPAAGSRKKAAKALDQIRLGLNDVSAINDDRLLRLYQDLICAVVRTNAFIPASQEALALKIDSAQVPGLPKPLPWRELFVYSRRVEGIHLRCGPVSRGGLRWSDRRDDYRAEILNLMKAQRVKNAVIVPTGAKGGFFPKKLPDPSLDRPGWAAEGQASYEIFIRSLLSVTDNIIGNVVQHPDGVVCLDGDDPYFVVAADKGTARFSDLANAIAERNNFWLGDAFASGGSNGYDHKAMGITARGAWISVQRHFIEMGVDIQKDPVRVVGCGDMSGDVFGNGMLLSRSIKLVAAFDHRHIFIDPDPVPEASWKERKRLFGMARSSWADYDPDLISTGGGVWPRTQKRIPISGPAREMLGVADSELSPDALISAILAAPADLLWFGGIGTYVKGSEEQHAQVRDPSNDELRINASQLRVKVIGEGANLATTQAGRIEFALSGGRINTDFIDNSAGVDCSDNEVNIKIALASAREKRRISEHKRTELLASMTQEVAEIVLEDNRLQALALSVAERGAAASASAHLRLIHSLEEAGNLDRSTAGLSDDETYKRRAMDGEGLTRPELAVLLASTKLILQDAIEQSRLPDDPSMVDVLLTSFPETMRSRFAGSIKDHRLRREIIATELANRIVNRLGIVLPCELVEETSTSLEQVAAAFTVADWLFDLHALWGQIERRDMDERARLLLLDRLAGIVRGHMAEILRTGSGHASPAAVRDTLKHGIDILSKNAGKLLQPEARRHSDNLHAELTGNGAKDTDANAVVHISDLSGAVGIAQLSGDTGIAPLTLAECYTSIGARLGLDWAQGVAATMKPADPWERLLASGLAGDLQQVRFDFLRQLTQTDKAARDPASAISGWSDDHRREIEQFRKTVDRARASAPVTSTVLAHIAAQARNLLTIR